MQQLQEKTLTIKRVRQHLLALGVSEKQTEKFVSLVDTWITNSGPEWTVERVKLLKQSMLEMVVTGEHYKVPLGWAVRQNRAGEKIFKNPLLHDIFTRAKTDMKMAFSFLRLYQAVRLKSLSPGQLRKMEKAITSPPTCSLEQLKSEASNFELRELAPREVELLSRIEDHSDCLMDFIGSSKRSPVFKASILGVFRYDGTYSRTQAEAFEFEYVLTHDKLANQLWNKFPLEVSKRLIGDETYPHVSGFSASKMIDMPAGTLVSIQEGGCKVRWIANPCLIWQAFGEPLKRKLDAFSKTVYPEIYTHDQDTGRARVSSWLAEGRTVYSYDCTSFTDRFPLVLQEVILLKLLEMGIITQFDFDAFALVMKKEWYSPRMKRTFRWEVGQPLGYGPSFHLATLSHAIILDNLNNHCWDRELWAVVGDDVVIADHGLAKAYETFMRTAAGVEINLSKSVISDRVAEFLGKLITKEGVIPSIKINSLKGPDQMTQAIAFYGEDSLSWLEGREKELALQSLLPTFMGGLGLRPKGMSYAEHLSLLNQTQVAYYQVKKDLQSFHGTAPEGDRVGVMKFIELRQEILTRNTKLLHDYFGITEYMFHLGEQATFNELSGIPAFQPRANAQGDVKEKSMTNFNSFVYLQDKSWAQSLHSQGPTRSQMCTSPVLTELGYIDHREVASTLVGNTFESIIQLTKDHCENKDQRRIKNFFRNWREILREVSTAGVEDCEPFTREEQTHKVDKTVR